MVHESSSAQPNPMDLMLGLIGGWFISRAIHVAAELGVADLLYDGPKSVPQLAAATDSHPQSLYRLLRMLASYGVFSEISDRRFELTPVGVLLRSDAFRDFARMVSDADWNGYGALLHTIKTGEPAFKHVNGLGFFDYLSTHSDAQLRFDRGMANAADAENAAIAGAYDFSIYKRIVDVGGGRGGFLAEILKAYRSPHGVLYDQPQVVAHPDYLTKAGVADRCDIVSGNFFESVPIGQISTCSNASCTIGPMTSAKVSCGDAAMLSPAAGASS
jgi:hypothetical protein